MVTQSHIMADKSDDAATVVTTATTDDTSTITGSNNDDETNHNNTTTTKSTRNFNLARLFLSSSDASHHYLDINSKNDLRHSNSSPLEDGSGMLQKNRNWHPNTMSSSEKNQFPTRAAMDFWKVDQRINYRNVEAANYDDGTYDGNANANDEGEELDEEASHKGPGQRFRPPRRDSIGVIQEGLQALRQGKLPDKEKKHHSMSFLSDETERQERKRTFLELDMDVKPSNVDKGNSKNLQESDSFSTKTGSCRKRFLTGVFICLVAILVTWTLARLVLIPVSHKVLGNLVVPDTSTDSTDTTSMVESPPQEEEPSMTASAIRRRTLVLEHVIEKDLLPIHSTNPDFLLTSPTARKAMTWMTGYDIDSMRLLDAYTYYHHHDDNTDGTIQLNKQYTTNQAEIAQKNKILDRYVKAALYFKDHADADLKYTILDWSPHPKDPSIDWPQRPKHWLIEPEADS